jgi:hypothetical protein
LVLAGLVTNGLVRFLLMCMSALHWLLLIDCRRCGVWLRDDGIDVRVPLQGAFRRFGWRDIDEMERTHTDRGKERLVLHLTDERRLAIPYVQDQPRLAAAIDAHVHKRASG